jgi:CheY-like chemotaxis protein
VWWRIVRYGGDVVSVTDPGAPRDQPEPRPLAIVADDEAAVRGVVIEALSRVGFETLAARDGHELVELATRHRPQLIVADVMMPGMDGYTAVARLRGQPATTGIPIIMLTGCIDAAFAGLSEGLGVSAHMTKPFSPLLLGELAQEMVRRSRK